MTHSPTATNRWLVKAAPAKEARLRLFCFPYAGGSAVTFRRWHEALPPDVEVIAVQLPGRGARRAEAPFTNMRPLVEAVAAVVAPHLDRPFALFGHSMGAAIAFELVRQLRRLYGAEPYHLFVSGRRAPHLPDTERPLHNMPEPEFVEELRRLNGTPPEVLAHKELMELMIPLLRADFSVAETYLLQPGEPLSCPLTAFGGVHDEHVEHEALAGWREHTTGPFAMKLFEGDHFFVETSRPLLLRAMAGALGAAG